MRHLFTAFAIVLALATVAIGVVFAINRPTQLQVAIAGSDTFDHRLFGAAADTLRMQRAPIRLEIVSVDDAAAAVTALEGGKAQLAVLRSDSIVSGALQTVLILRREAAVVAAPKTGKVQKTADLAGATIGVVREGPSAAGVLAPVLDFYGISASRLRMVPMRQGEIAQAFQQRRIDALVAVGAPSSKYISEAVAEAARSARGGLQFLDLDEADAIAKRASALESIEIDAGTFGGRPPRPAESISTIGYSIRLVAHQKVDNEIVAEVTRQLLTIRQNLNVVVPGADLIAAPKTDEVTPLLAHPGVRIYVNGEQKSFLERYSDYIYLTLFVLTGVGSLGAGILSRSNQRRRHQAMQSVARIERIVEPLRSAHSVEDLDAVERQIDDVFHEAMSQLSGGSMDATSIAAFEIAVADARRRLAAARTRLAGAQEAAPPVAERPDSVVTRLHAGT